MKRPDRPPRRASFPISATGDSAVLLGLVPRIDFGKFILADIEMAGAVVSLHILGTRPRMTARCSALRTTTFSAGRSPGPKMKGRGLARPFALNHPFPGWHCPPSGGQGRTPIIRAPMKANAAHITMALIGLVSPMHSLLVRAMNGSLGAFMQQTSAIFAALRQDYGRNRSGIRRNALFFPAKATRPGAVEKTVSAYFRHVIASGATSPDYPAPWPPRAEKCARRS